MRVQRLLAMAMVALAALTLAELVADVTILGEAQPLVFGLLLLAWIAPAARNATGTRRTVARVGVFAALVLVVGAVGELLA